MRPGISPIRFLALVSVAGLASSCGGNVRPTVQLSVPADLLQRRDRPPIPVEAVASEAAYEGWRDDVQEWGEENAGIIDRACAYLKDAGVTLTCRARPQQ